MKKVEKLSKDIEAEMVVLTGGKLPAEKHTWTFGEPDKEGLRTVHFDGNGEGKGILKGSVAVVGGGLFSSSSGHIVQSFDIEVGRHLGVRFPDRPKSMALLISNPVTFILVSEKTQVK